jgi:hypothetical protein
MVVFLILMVGALSGLVLAQVFSWLGLVWCAPVLAVVSAVLLQRHGFGWPAGFATIVACLSLNQIGYLIGTYFRIKPTIHHASDTRTTSPKSTIGTKASHLTFFR